MVALRPAEGILSVPFDVFISHASQDRVVANAVCARLEAAGIRCWIAPRDIVAGTSYGESIIEAIRAAKVMVLVFSSNANASGQVPKEVERAVSNGLAILPFRIEDVAPGKSLDYFIGSIHWLDAMTPPMEQHLDDLAETVRKLVPQPAGVQGAPGAPATGAQIPYAGARMPMQPTAVGPASGAGNQGGSSSKTVWMGAAAVLAVAVILMAVKLMIPKPVPPPPAVNPTPVQPVTPVNQPTGQVTPVGPNPRPGVATNDPIVGCYTWFNGGAVVINENGTMTGGPFPGRWQVVDASRRAYTFTWPAAIATVAISPDQRSLGGMNQYGYPIKAGRIGGSVGLDGTWMMTNGVSVVVSADGTFTSANFKGTWRGVNAALGTYALTWPGPIDSVTLSADGSKVAGANQYGVTITGTRTRPCPGT